MADQLRAAAEQALEAWDTRAGIDAASRAFEALRAALAQQAEPVQSVATFDEVWAAIDWDKWRLQPIRELVRMIHSKTSPAAPVQQAEPVQEPVAHKHEWFSTGAMEPGQMRCIHCGIWNNEATPQQTEPLTPEWIWSWLMDWCKQNGTSPANYDSLFKMVSDARAIEAAHGIKEAK